MLRIYTGRIVALVTYTHTVRNRAIALFVRVSVRAFKYSRTYIEQAVTASIYCAMPDNAVADALNLGHETVLNGAHTTSAEKRKGALRAPLDTSTCVFGLGQIPVFDGISPLASQGNQRY